MHIDVVRKELSRLRACAEYELSEERIDYNQGYLDGMDEAIRLVEPQKVKLQEVILEKYGSYCKFALATRVTQPMVCGYAKRGIVPSVKIALRLAKALGCSVEDIWGDIDDED